MLLEELLLKYKKHRKNIVIYFSVLSTDSRKNLKELLDTKDSELNERKQSQNLSDKVREQKSKIESLNCELERLKLFQ